MSSRASDAAFICECRSMEDAAKCWRYAECLAAEEAERSAAFICECRSMEDAAKCWRYAECLAAEEAERSAASVQDRPPNFRGEDGSLYLVRCFVCSPEIGRENYAPNVASGVCTWCGWREVVPIESLLDAEDLEVIRDAD